MLLKPEEVGLFDLYHILFSSKLEEKKFVDCPEGTVTEEINFRRRWLIFVSILAQKFLQLVSKPLSVVGSGIETCLNLVSVNRNIFVLTLNTFRGKSLLPCALLSMSYFCLSRYACSITQERKREFLYYELFFWRKKKRKN